MGDTIIFNNLVEINPQVQIQRDMEYPFVEMADIIPGHRYVKAKEIRRFTGGGSRFSSGDVLFARITPCLENGKIAQFNSIEKSAFGSTEFIVFRKKENISDQAFIYYLANSEIIRKPAEKSMSGASGRQRADLSTIKNTEVPNIPLPTQRKIAAILSAYDDLIENNLRRIKTLEEMAQNLYREWFVNFHYPGLEKAKMVDSPLGNIPEGWEIQSATDAIFINPPVNVSKDSNKAYVAMEGLSNTSMLINVTGYRQEVSGSKYQNGDTLFARITPCLENGKTGFVQFLSSNSESGIGSTEFIVLRSRTLTPEYVYFMARSESFRENAIKSMSGASGRQRVQNEAFKKYNFVHPDKGSLIKFSEIVSPMFKLVHQFSQKNVNLRQTRNLLLPKLISGELDVSDLDIKVEDAA
jgi:type I restriction enzyme, S subunit